MTFVATRDQIEQLKEENDRLREQYEKALHVIKLCAEKTMTGRLKTNPGQFRRTHFREIYED